MSKIIPFPDVSRRVCRADDEKMKRLHEALKKMTLDYDKQSQVTKEFKQETGRLREALKDLEQTCRNYLQSLSPLSSKIRRLRGRSLYLSYLSEQAEEGGRDVAMG